MSATRVVCHVEPDRVPAGAGPNEIHVLLYGTVPIHEGTGIAGGQLPDLASRFGLVLRDEAFDFVSIALAVTACDTFVMRDTGDDGWSREFDVTIPVTAPDTWEKVRVRLEGAFRFLSGDVWNLRFVAGGRRPPQAAEVRKRHRVIPLDRVDCACLFSGGLDSATGAYRLMLENRRPLLVSHVYRGDKGYQDTAARLLPRETPRVGANFYPTWQGVDDDSMRTRSISFMGLGVLAATAISQFRRNRVIDLIMPENGFIAVNAPLTPRRVGTHSTRTAHPYFLDEIRAILEAVGLPVRLINPFEHSTKGEMVRSLSDRRDYARLALATVSCGKWKRKSMQCGRCVPCLVRRAAFHAGGIGDTTRYECSEIAQVMDNETTRDDIIAALSAIRRLRSRPESARSWVLQAGPLPIDKMQRDAYVGVVERGIGELESFLGASGLT
jgi:hypothetical protein